LGGWNSIPAQTSTNILNKNMKEKIIQFIENMPTGVWFAFKPETEAEWIKQIKHLIDSGYHLSLSEDFKKFKKIDMDFAKVRKKR
jgi:hypothetical protein